MDDAVDGDHVASEKYAGFDSRSRRRHVVIFVKLLQSSLHGAFRAAMIVIKIVNCPRSKRKTILKIK